MSPAEAYARIKATQQLPTPAGVALEVLRLAELDDATVDQIGEVIARDPALTGRFLKLVNSPICAQRKRVGSIQRAVGLLGIRTVKSLALGFSLGVNAVLS